MHPRRFVLTAGLLAIIVTACSPADGAEPAATSAPPPASIVSSDPTVDASTGDTGTGSTFTDSGGENASGDLVAFDPSVVHTISVQYAEDDYDAMIATYQETGEKEWIEATVTIDGATFERAGLRLKGNSSLGGLGRGPGGGPSRLGTPDGPAAAPEESVPKDSVPEDSAPDELVPDELVSDEFVPDERPPGPPGGGGFGGASADEPERLPWLVRVDKFVEGQTYQGYEDFVVRSNRTATAMNEAVSLALLTQVGLASQDAMATRFSVNGRDEVLRLVIEHPDDDQWYETRFDGDGALYKAESTGDWSYRGDDSASYEEVFDQEGGSDIADLAPLIEFLDFINNADDDTFAAELPDRLDVRAFATYLAMMKLLDNGDDIDGPGNNAYLWWDAETEQFTVVPWDMNLTLRSDMGGPGRLPDRGDAPGVPDVRPLPPGGSLPDLPGGTLPEGAEPPFGDGLAGSGPFGGRSNPLVQRFLANEKFNASTRHASPN